MLLDDFFQIQHLKKEGFDITADLVINPGHRIFDGHFPGQPVVPGVCMMQMIKEVMQTVTGKRMNILKAHEMKFLAVIDPRQNNNISSVITYSADEKIINVTATLFKEEIIHFKFKAQFDFQEPYPA